MQKQNSVCLINSINTESSPRTYGDYPNDIYGTVYPLNFTPYIRGLSRICPLRSGNTTFRPVPTGIIPPTLSLFPIIETSPRTYGDYPHRRRLAGKTVSFAPYLRGLSHHEMVSLQKYKLHPVPTGIIPSPCGAISLHRTSPRTYGDYPKEKRRI